MPPVLFMLCSLAPVALMLLVTLVSVLHLTSLRRLWQAMRLLAGLALLCLLLATCFGGQSAILQPWLQASAWSPCSVVALLVQLLGTVIAAFSARYLHGESGQRRYVAALAAVLAAVQLLLLADHWVVLIAAWALVGVALQHLLCFYPERAFARLAAHKKRLADRLADALLIGAAALAWSQVGSGSLSDLWLHIAHGDSSIALQGSAVLLVLAVILRTALLPVHGWLIQVMEAPTPVSALLHAGVVNLGGVVLIRFAPLLKQAMPARALLLLFGLCSAVLAGMVMLTRISIKVRLAWSTLAQMGFMLVECSLGLYTLALLHLVGHSLYKAQAFLQASSVVRTTRLQKLHSGAPIAPFSLCIAPLLTSTLVLALANFPGHGAWPWWWSGALGFSWGPLLWLPLDRSSGRAAAGHLLCGLSMVSALTGMGLLAHLVPLGMHDAPHDMLGLVAMLGMLGLYLALATLQRFPHALQNCRRWSYACFYVDEIYTRLALRIWPVRWVPTMRTPAAAQASTLATGVTQ